MNGTNKDDFSDYRPGLIAANENAIRSPLSESGINKREVRELAKQFGIPFWDKPASPCLSSRIPYGNQVTAFKLNQIEKTENYLNSLGFINVRARHYGNDCKIEVPLDKLQQLKAKFDSIEQKVFSFGFTSCTIDEEGLISGKLNNVLNLNDAKS